MEETRHQDEVLVRGRREPDGSRTGGRPWRSPLGLTVHRGGSRLLFRARWRSGWRSPRHADPDSRLPSSCAAPTMEPPRTSAGPVPSGAFRAPLGSRRRAVRIVRYVQAPRTRLPRRGARLGLRSTGRLTRWKGRYMLGLRATRRERTLTVQFAEDPRFRVEATPPPRPPRPRPHGPQSGSGKLRPQERDLTRTSEPGILAPCAQAGTRSLTVQIAGNLLILETQPNRSTWNLHESRPRTRSGIVLESLILAQDERWQCA